MAENGWVIVTGINSGLGKEIGRHLVADGHDVFGVGLGRDPGNDSRTDGRHCDVSSKESVKALLGYLQDDPVVGIVNCAGVNHLDWLPDLEEEDWDRVMDTNAKGIYLMSHAFLPHLQEARGFICNITSNAAHTPMRASLAYNASKGAAHIMTLQLARELAPEVTVFGVAPNKMAGTEMSRYIEGRVTETRGWTPEEAREYQLKSLVAGEETDPGTCAEFIAFLLSSRKRHKYLAGCILPYGA